MHNPIALLLEVLVIIVVLVLVLKLLGLVL